MRLIQRHGGGGRGERAPAVKADIVGDFITRVRARLDDRITVLDIGQARHAVEQRAFAPVDHGIPAELDERCVNVGRGNHGVDPVQPSLGHELSFLFWSAE
jgi:hypothetical protein